MVTYEEWMKIGYLKTFYNGVHLEKEGKDNLEIGGCMK